ncbi:Glucose-induced degradation protein 8 [Paragonimus heterotremus]|uniref:Glucose-induced degradation protein 8 n=1 Tax=Paragonimus heterotremus TaxID=100268 RepID=A0A8J4WFE8_9TREM|nr:Glucose-induced degradation protein 8 [Paragonimus heterotremus]
MATPQPPSGMRGTETARFSGRPDLTCTNEPAGASVPLHTLDSIEHHDGLSLTRQEINRLILEYLVVEGYKDAAEKFSRETGICEPLTEMRVSGESLVDRMWIREAVLRRQIEEVIDTVNRLWPELFDKNPFIYFQLRQLQMLELIRNRRLEDALIFAQSYLADPVAKRLSEHPQLLNEMQNTMALLAFDDPAQSIYGQLLGPQHAELVAGALNRAILRHIEASGDDIDGSDEGKTSTNSTGYSAASSTVPRLTKMMAMLLHFKDLAQLELPAELASL